MTSRTRIPLRIPRTIAAVALALSFATAAAQGPSVPALLPAETVLAVGTHDLASHADKLQPYIDEAERLGLVEHVSGVLGEGAEDEVPEVPSSLSEVGPMDVLGAEAWLAVSISEFNPLPAATFAFVPSDAASAAVADAIDQAGLEAFEEGGTTFYQRAMGADLPPFAVANLEDLVVVSTQPEVLRSVLRKRAGADEPSLLDSDLWGATVGQLGDAANAYGLLDLAPAVPALRPLAQQGAPPALLDRVEAIVTTIGPSGSVMRLSDEGIASASRQVPASDGGDPDLHALLTADGAADSGPMAFVPEGALSVSVSTLDVRGWWDWLGSVLASVPELGLPTLSELTQMVGIDAESALLSWSGDQAATIVTAAPAPAQPGEVEGALLGEQVFILESTDDAAAFDGLRTLLRNVGMQASALADPSGQPSGSVEVTSVAGVDVARMEITDNLAVSAAATGGYALLAGSDDAMAAVLNAYAEGSGPPQVFADLAEAVPGTGRAFALSDDRAALEGSVDALISQFQLGAGMAGGGAIDFEAVEAASEAFADFATFVADRIGGSHAVTTVEDGVLVGEGLSRVEW